MLLAHKDESKDRMSIRDGLAGHKVRLTVAIFSTAAWNFSNVLRNEEIQSTRVIGLSVPLSADAALWTGAATVLMSEMAFVAASRATSTVVTSEASSWSDGVSWFIHEHSDGCLDGKGYNREDLGRVSFRCVGSDI